MLRRTARPNQASLRQARSQKDRPCDQCRALKASCIITQRGRPCQRCSKVGRECTFAKPPPTRSVQTANGEFTMTSDPSPETRVPAPIEIRAPSGSRNPSGSHSKGGNGQIYELLGHLDGLQQRLKGSEVRDWKLGATNERTMTTGHRWIWRTTELRSLTISVGTIFKRAC